MTVKETDGSSGADLHRDQDRRRLLVGFVHIVALNALAVAQPLLDVVGNQAEFFVAHQAGRGDVLLFALLALAVLPAVVIGIDAIAWAVGRSFHTVVHATIIAIYVALFSAHVLARYVDFGLWIHILVSLGIGVVFALLYTRLAGLRSFVTFLAPAPVAVGFLFLFASSASGIVFPDNVDSAIASGDSSDSDVVFIVFDELPIHTLLDDEGFIDDRYPAFARLASMADWFPNATTLSDASHIALPSILAGVEPDPAGERLPVLEDYPLNVFTALAPTHEVYASERITELCPDEVCGSERVGVIDRTTQIIVDSGVAYAHIIFPESARYRLPDISNQWTAFVDIAPVAGLTSEEGLEQKRFNDFVDALGSFDAPGLYFIHSVLPHRPWVYAADGTLYETALVPGHDTIHPAKWLGNEYLVSQGYERHRAQTRFADRMLGKALDRLEAMGLLESTVIVVTADHGINFTPHEFDRTATLETYDQILPIPLFVKASDQSTGSVVETPVEIVDLLATILDLVDLPWSDRTQGFSVYDPTYVPQPKRFFNDVEEVSLDTATIDVLGSRADVISMVDGSSPSEANELLGRSVVDIGAESDGSSATIRGLDRFSDVDVGAGPMPLHILGMIDGSLPAEAVSLALAVNGVIVSSGRTYAEGPITHLFSLLIPSSSLVDGPNRLQLFFIDTNGLPVEATISDGSERG